MSIIYRSIYIYIHTHICISCVHIYIYIYIYTYIYIYIYISIHVVYIVSESYPRTGVKLIRCRPFAETDVRGPLYIYIYIYIYIYTCNIYIYIHIIVAIFYPFSQFCEINISLLSLQKQANTAPNLFQRGVEYGKYIYIYI